MGPTESCGYLRAGRRGGTKLVQFARTSAFCKNSCAQRPRLTPRSRTRPRQPQGTADHKPGSWPERVPGTRRRVRHGGRPGARRAGGTRQVHRADPGRGLVAARRADGTRLGRPGCATAVGLRVPIGPVPYRHATPAATRATGTRPTGCAPPGRPPPRRAPPGSPCRWCPRPP